MHFRVNLVSKIWFCHKKAKNKIKFFHLGFVVRPDDNEPNSMWRAVTLSGGVSDALCVQLQWSWEAPQLAHLELTSNNGSGAEVQFFGTQSVDGRRTRVQFQHLPPGEFLLTLRNVSDEIVQIDLCPGEKWKLCLPKI